MALPLSPSTSGSGVRDQVQPIGWTIWETWDWLWQQSDAEAGSFQKPCSTIQPRNEYQGGPLACRIRRIIIFFDTTGIDYDLALRLYVSSKRGTGSLYIVNGNGADYDFGVEIYGWIRGRYSAEYLIATRDLTALPTGYNYFLIPSAHINSSGYTVLILVMGADYEYSGSPTGWVNISLDWQLNTPPLSGYIWVEGTKLAYTDSVKTKRTTEGTLDGASGKEAGIHWVEGTKQRYIDSSGNERCIEGTLTGLTGKVASQLSINTKSPMSGTHYCYIDSSGKERCFEGT